MRPMTQYHQFAVSTTAMTSKEQSNITPLPILVHRMHCIAKTDPGTIRRIHKYYPVQKFQLTSIAAVLTGPFLGAFGQIWEVHQDNKEVTICSNFGLGRYQDIKVKMEIVEVGGEITDPYELCILEDKEQSLESNSWASY